MSDSRKPPRSADYDVGYGKPPKSGQFKKGQSGNPNGRPKGAKNKTTASLRMINNLVIKEANREVILQDKDGPVSISVIQAALRTLGVKAIQGNTQASKVLIAITSKAEAEEFGRREQAVKTATAYKEAKRAEIRAAKGRGEEPPLMLPHPEDIEIKYETLEVIFHGPADQDDLRLWNKLHGTIATLAEEIHEFRELLAALDDDDSADDEAVGGNGGDEDDDVETFDWIPHEIEDHQFIIMTACLTIARRWRLPSAKILMSFGGLLGCISWDEFKRHLRDGTDPVPPNAYKDIVEAKRNGELH